MKNIWDTEYETKAPVTDTEVIEAEKKLGIKLPESYIELCKIHNGGSIIYDSFPTSVPTGWADDHVSVTSIAGIDEEGILSSSYYIEEWELPQNIVLLEGDGHWWIAMDYRERNENPSIIYIDLEADVDPFILELAPDFKSFVEGLYTHED